MTPEDIKKIRLSLGRTQMAMAKIVGTSHVTWSRWEHGHTVPIKVFRDKLQVLLDRVESQTEGEGNRTTE